MELTSSYIILRDVRFRAFHGVMPQERQVGGDFIITLKVGCPLEKAMAGDNLTDTLNYARLYEVVREEMRQPSQLLEHVAGRIIKAIEDTFPEVTSIDLTLSKKNPPMGADCDSAGIELHTVRKR